MNAKLTAAFVFAVAAASPVFASDYGVSDQSRTAVTRAEVRAEVLRARAAGELEITEANFPFSVATPKSTLSRAEVRAEAIRALNSGELAAPQGEFAFDITTPKSTLTRAEVRSEVARARAAGELDITEASPAFALK